MMNLSSLSKIHYANYAHLAVITLGLIVSGTLFEFHLVSFLFGLTNIAIALYAYRQISTITKNISNTANIITQAVKDGNFENRQICVNDGGEIAELAWNINDLLTR
ncbi:MAG: hypothetical protein Q9M40_11145 [Sulfurimonas sp.]|nr:hypothetical protein [Sulfurimonas sp.]